jgi:glycosyltransferase involved in cell wall biosynthesis
MKILFIHQNFPAQFIHLAQHFVNEKHTVVALGIQGRAVAGVKFLRYVHKSTDLPKEVPYVQDLYIKSIRGLACANVMQRLERSGFKPDIVIAHTGWGEALFAKDVWPDVPVLSFLEFFYHSQGADYGFDHEFNQPTMQGRHGLRLRNASHLMAMHAMDWGYTPTQWQFSTLPPEYKDRVSVVFDGIDTQAIAPNAEVVFTVPGTQRLLRKQDQVITFVNRNIEPYRGCHTFFRALPRILKQSPNAVVVIVGEDGISYGAAAPEGKTWRGVFLDEVKSQLPAGWENRVLFVGRLERDAFTSLLQVSACHVYLTYPFILSWSCLEAMAAGCTVVASNAAPVQEVIQDGVNGLLTDFFDVAALAERVSAVIGSPERYAPLGTNARNTVVSRYDLKTKCLPSQIALVHALVTGVLPRHGAA